MFRVTKTENFGLIQVGIAWKVVEELFDGTTRDFAYFERQEDARQVAETLNEQATVVAAGVELATDWSLDCDGPVS